jgi:hypothetical protein
MPTGPRLPNRESGLGIAGPRIGENPDPEAHSKYAPELPEIEPRSDDNHCGPAEGTCNTLSLVTAGEATPERLCNRMHFFEDKILNLTAQGH